MTSFGFEAEFADGVLAMLPLLHGEGLLGESNSTGLHSYHCDCGDCDYPGQVFRAQSDSSCGGEIISRPFGKRGFPVEDAWRAMEALQAAAVEADAVPGTQAGFHVHVNAVRLNVEQRSAMLWEWVRWEPTMCALASGAFRLRRQNNYPVGGNFRAYMREAPGRTASMRYDEWSVDDIFRNFVPGLSTSTLEEVMQGAYFMHYESDRHSLLNCRTRFETFEFRLWNSTRSAWRMELFARLSLAWMKPAFVAGLADEAMPAWIDENRLFDRNARRSVTYNVGKLRAALVRSGEDARTLELFDRQERFRTSTVTADYEPVFTAA